MLEKRQHQSAMRIALALALALSTAGCAMPSIGMPKIPFVSGDRDPDKETWSEARARKKDERAERKEAREEARLARRDARRGGSSASSADQDARDQEFFDRNDPYDNRQPTSRMASSNPGPAGISPYGDNRDASRRSPASAVEMAPGERAPQLSGEPMQRRVDFDECEAGDPSDRRSPAHAAQFRSDLYTKGRCTIPDGAFLPWL